MEGLRGGSSWIQSLFSGWKLWAAVLGFGAFSTLLLTAANTTVTVLRPLHTPPPRAVEDSSSRTKKTPLMKRKPVTSGARIKANDCLVPFSLVHKMNPEQIKKVLETCKDDPPSLLNIMFSACTQQLQEIQKRIELKGQMVGSEDAQMLEDNLNLWEDILVLAKQCHHEFEGVIQIEIGTFYNSYTDMTDKAIEYLQNGFDTLFGELDSAKSFDPIRLAPQLRLLCRSYKKRADGIEGAKFLERLADKYATFGIDTRSNEDKQSHVIQTDAYFESEQIQSAATERCIEDHFVSSTYSLLLDLLYFFNELPEVIRVSQKMLDSNLTEPKNMSFITFLYFQTYSSRARMILAQYEAAKPFADWVRLFRVENMKLLMSRYTDAKQRELRTMDEWVEIIKRYEQDVVKEYASDLIISAQILYKTGKEEEARELVKSINSTLTENTVRLAEVFPTLIKGHSLIEVRKRLDEVGKDNGDITHYYKEPNQLEAAVVDNTIAGVEVGAPNVSLDNVESAAEEQIVVTSQSDEQQQHNEDHSKPTTQQTESSSVAEDEAETVLNEIILNNKYPLPSQ